MENDTWAQTLFTITPEEDGYIREITETTVISAPESTPLDLDTENIAHRETLVNIKYDFIDPRELEKTEFQESECQTYMKGIPKVQYVISHKDEASQTLYIGRNCPPVPGQTAKTIVSVLNKKVLPKLKKSQLAQTIITVLDDLPDDEIIEGLLQEITEEEQNDTELMVNATEDELPKIESSDLMNFMIDRTMWIADTSPDVIFGTRDVEVETTIKYNYHLKRFMIDSGVQTSMTLEPSKSNSRLLDNYLEVKGFVGDLLEETMDTGVYNRIFIDDLEKEIIDRCSEFVHLPLKDEAIQTLASGQPFEARDDEFLKRMKRSVMSDPVEASAMVQPIVDGILNEVVETVCVDARDAAKFIVDRVVRKTIVIGKKLDDIQNVSHGPPMDQILALRKRKLARSMPKKKEMEDASTQTGLAGVPQLRKFQENKEVACCVCPTQSKCHWCLAGEDEPPKKDTQLLHTQDILLAYKPCYVVMNPAEATLDMRPPCPPEPQELTFRTHVSRDSETSTESSSSYEKCPCMSDIHEKLEVAESASGWSDVINTALTDAWVFPETPSKGSKSTTSTKQSPSICKTSKSQIPLSKTTIEALQILKTTFCNRVTCPGLSNVIGDPKHLSSEMLPKTSSKNKQSYVCNNVTPPGSEECICEFFNERIQEKLKILSIKKIEK